MREARDEPEPNSIDTTGNHDDGDRLGGLLGCHRCWCRDRYDDVCLEPDQFGREVGQPLVPTLRKSIVDDEVLSPDVAEIAERVLEGVRIERGWTTGAEIADSIYRPRLLGLGGQRRGKRTGQRSQQEAAAVHAGMVGRVASQVKHARSATG